MHINVMNRFTSTFCDMENYKPQLKQSALLTLRGYGILYTVVKGLK